MIVGRCFRNVSAIQVILWVVTCVTLNASDLLAAWDLRDKPFGFRLQLTDDRMTYFFPASHPIISMNPAGDDLTHEPPFEYNARGLLASEIAHFGSSGWVTIFSPLAFLRLGDSGTAGLFLHRTDVHDSTTLQGQRFELDTSAATFRYSHRVGPDWSVGGSIKVGRNHTSLEDSSVNAASAVVKGEYALGVMGRLSSQWTTGLFVTVAPSWIDTNIQAGGAAQELKQTTVMTRVRGGFGWQPSPDKGVYFDTQYLRIRNKTDAANLARFMLVGEQFVTPTIPIRLGLTLDTELQATPMVGFGLYNLMGLNFDFYYGYNSYPEIRHELGKTNYWLIGVGKSF